MLVVASAWSYPQGVIDPVAEIAALAADRGINCHVDACMGGMVLPFMERLGEPVPPWDFRVPGVTSISVDLHKYGYAALWRRGWWCDQQAPPPSLHCTVHAGHRGVIGPFLAALDEAVMETRSTGGSAAPVPYASAD